MVVYTMRRIRTFMDYLQSNAGSTKHKRKSEYQNIYAKIIYQVANTPLDKRQNKRCKAGGHYRFHNELNRYWMVR